MQHVVKFKEAELHRGTVQECLTWLANLAGDTSARSIFDQGYSIEKAAP